MPQARIKLDAAAEVVVSQFTEIATIETNCLDTFVNMNRQLGKKSGLIIKH